MTDPEFEELLRGSQSSPPESRPLASALDAAGYKSSRAASLPRFGAVCAVAIAAAAGDSPTTPPPSSFAPPPAPRPCAVREEEEVAMPRLPRGSSAGEVAQSCRGPAASGCDAGDGPTGRKPRVSESGHRFGGQGSKARRRARRQAERAPQEEAGGSAGGSPLFEEEDLGFVPDPSAGSSAGAADAPDAVGIELLLDVVEAGSPKEEDPSAEVDFGGDADPSPVPSVVPTVRLPSRPSVCGGDFSAVPPPDFSVPPTPYQRDLLRRL